MLPAKVVLVDEMFGLREDHNSDLTGATTVSETRNRLKFDLNALHQKQHQSREQITRCATGLGG